MPNEKQTFADKLKGAEEYNIKKGLVKTAPEVEFVPEYQGADVNYKPLPGDYYDKFEDYINKDRLKSRQTGIEQLKELRFENQSRWEQFGNGWGRVAVNIIPQAISGFASMLDIKGYWDAEHAANNAIVNWAMDAKKTVDEDWFPIYTDPKGDTMDLSSFSWWMSRGSGLVESIGSFLIQGAGVGAGVNLLSKAAKATMLAKALAGSELGTLGAKGAKSLVSATMLNQSEAVIEATQVFRDTYEGQIAKGFSYEDAKKAAANAASATMRWNRANILLNLTSASMFLTPTKSLRQLMSNPAFKSQLGHLAAEGGQEALEELINLAASKRGMAVGEGKEFSIKDGLKAMGTMEGLEAAFLGAIGGLGQAGGTLALQRSKYGPGSTVDTDGNRISKYSQLKERYEKQQEILDEMKKSGVSQSDALLNIKDFMVFQEELSEAIENDDTVKLEELKAKRFENQVFKAIESGTTGVLVDMYKHESERQDVSDEYRENAKKAIKDISLFEKEYINNEENVNIKDIFYNRANKIRAERALQLTQELKANIRTEFEKNVSTIAKKHSFTDEKETIPQTRSMPLNYDIENINENKGQTELQKKEYEAFLEDVQKLDSYKNFIQKQEEEAFYKSELERHDKELSDLKSKEVQEKVKAEQAVKAKEKEAFEEIKKTSEISKLEKIKKDFPNSQEIQREVDAKLETIKRNAKAEAENKAKDFVKLQLSTKIEAVTLEQLESEDGVKALRDEINDAELDNARKTALNNQLDDKISALNGEEVEFVEPDAPVSKGEVESTENVNKSHTPSGIPNPNTEENDVEAEVEGALRILQENQANAVGTDADGNIIYDYERPKTGANRAAYLSRLFKQVKNLFTMNRSEVNDELLNTHILDVNALPAGTSLTISVDAEYSGEKYVDGSETKETETWKIKEEQLKAKYSEQGIDYKTTDEYIGQVPMAVKDNKGNVVFYIHDISWIDEQNLSGTKSELEADRDELLRMRKAVIKKGTIKTKVTYKGTGKLFKSADKSSVSLREAFGDNNSDLIFAVGQNNRFKIMFKGASKLQKGKNGKGKNKILGKAPESGATYVLLPISPTENIPIRISKQPLSEQLKRSALAAVEAYLTNNTENELGIDVSDINGLRNYLQNFIYFMSQETGETLDDVLLRKTSTFNSGVAVFTTTGNGIEFGRPGVGNKNTRVQTISRNIVKTETEIKKVMKLFKEALDNTLCNANKDALQEGLELKLINEDGTVTSTTYYDYIRDNFKTNLRSANIGTEEKPNWVYTVQPTILFDTSFAEPKKNTRKKESKATPQPSSVSENTETKPDIEQQVGDLANLIVQAELVKDIQGNEFETVDDEDVEELDDADFEDSFSEEDSLDELPPELTEEQLKDLKIANRSSYLLGISLAEQEALISYIASEVVRNAVEETGVNATQVINQVRQALIRQQASFKEKNLVNKAKKIEYILKQFDKVKRLSEEHLSLLSTGKLDKTIEELEDSEASMGEVVYEDNWTFTLDSKVTASAELRKFFSFIDKVENGKNKISSLGFPERVDFDTIYNTLHQVLANQIPDFNHLISILTVRQESFPWLKNVITRLQNAEKSIQNEFTSDMTKHDVKMSYITWKKLSDGSYQLENWNANSAAIQQRLRTIWKIQVQGLNGSNLLSVDSDEQYRFNQKTVDAQLAAYFEFAKNPDEVTVEDLDKWLSVFGITLEAKTLKSLKEGAFYNKGKISWKGLFLDARGIVAVLAGRLEKERNLTFDNITVYEDTAVKALAALEANNRESVLSNSFQSGNKTLYTFSNNKYIVNRFRELTQRDEKGLLKNTQLLNDLRSLSFSKNSLWLDDLERTDEIGEMARDAFGYETVGLEALKKKFGKSTDNASLADLSPAAHEIFKIAHFFRSIGQIDPITGERRREVGFVSSTFSDKSTMLILKALARSVKLNEDNTLTEESLELLYKATVEPEVNRILGKKSQNVKGSEPDYFYFFPSFNTTLMKEGNSTTLRDAVINAHTGITDELKDRLKLELSKSFDALLTGKLKDWEKLGIGKTEKNAKGEVVTKNSFLNTSYMRQIASKTKNPVTFAAADFVFNNLITNAESHKTLLGDPALYAKFDSRKSVNQNMLTTYGNIGKRLAMMIAPGLELANSHDETYHQVFLNDQKVNSSNIDDSEQLAHFTRISPTYAKDYAAINGSDAQEYTTWREHLRVLDGLGRIKSKDLQEITSRLEQGKTLSDKQLKIILQPMKPVYAGAVMEVDNNVERMVYIKSSSFPLLPQFTKTFQIDKIRKALENKENELRKNNPNATVRASFQTANKVGAVKGVNVFDKKGNVLDNISITDENTLNLPRKNFRIQQDVPYSDTKTKINIGTQERVLLFVNTLELEIEPGVTGQDLYNSYLKNYEDLFEHAKENLSKRLGLENGKITNLKLAEILKEEVMSRSGYPMNIMDALELDDKGNFIIPLWASPYADKFESLLTSIVSKGVIKQKFTGASHVLGSPEGFKLQEGVTEEELKQMGVVTSPNFDGSKGLLPMRYDKESGKMLPAQVMLPFKFRDEKGNLLNVKDFTTDGKIDFDKIPQKLLQLFGFRIPTQERNSMGAVEIVGFIPEEQGDLLLTPRDFVAQMGSDFDVDKMYSYMYNYHYSDGKFSTDFESNLETIENKIEELKQDIEVLKQELSFSFDEDLVLKKFSEREGLESFENILSILGKIPKQELKQELTKAFRELSVLKRSYVASRQNAILDIHMRMMLSTNEDVQKSIVAIDSFGEFKDFAEQFTSEELPISMLSDVYQRTKYTNAVGGKMGTAVFSLDSTFNAVVQGKDLVFTNLSNENRGILFAKGNTPTASEILAANEAVATFGEEVSKGDLSNIYTLRSQKIVNKAKREGRKLNDKERSLIKYKSTIIRALQSSAVDHENAQIIDKLNINAETFDAIRALTMLGFEEADIVGLLNQPLILEYTELLKIKRDNLEGFISNVEEKVFTELRNKYDSAGRFGKESLELTNTLKNLSGVELVKIALNPNVTISEQTTSDETLQQLLLLAKFRELSEKGVKIKILQSTINTQSSGLPKSLLEVSAKIEQVEKIENHGIFNAGKLLENTVHGLAIENGLLFANRIFSKSFPYQNSALNIQFEEVLEHLGEDREAVNSSAQLAELKNEIFNHVKSYMFANNMNKLFEGEVNAERSRLFIDTASNKSLATVLEKLQATEYFKTNKFLNKLILETKKDGSESRILFEASTAENFDEKAIYLAFQDLIERDAVIGTVDGIEYKSRKIGQDLIAAAYLSGGIQQAKQYLKYIPQNYLKIVGFGDYLNSGLFNYETVFGGNDAYNQPSRFTLQYFQNNPSKAKTISGDDIKNLSKDGTTFTLTEEAKELNKVRFKFQGNDYLTSTHFLSTYDTATNKVRLYQYNDDTKQYHEIETLNRKNTFYQYSTLTKAIDVKTKGVLKPLSNSLPQQTRSEKNPQPSSAFDSNVLNNSEAVTDKLELNESLSSNDAVNEIFNQLETSNNVSVYSQALIEAFRELELPQGLEIIYQNDSELGYGAYNKDSNKLYLNKHKINENSIDKNALKILHELTHVHTSSAIKAYEQGEFDKLSNAQISALVQLKDLQLKYIEHLKKNGKEAELETFRQAYNEYKKTRNVTFSAEDLSEFYGAIKLSEFVTMALTDKGFQEILNKVEDGEALPFWKQLTELLVKLLNTLGLDVDPKSLLARALEESMNLVESSAEKNASVVVKEDETLDIVKNNKITINNIEISLGNITLNEQQSKALQNIADFVDNVVKGDVTDLDISYTLSGYAGTGKTTITKFILEYINKKRKYVKLASPTHRAKEVLSSLTGSKALTLAKVLGLRPGVELENYNLLDKIFTKTNSGEVPINGILIVDEASMINNDLYATIISTAKDNGTKVIFIGDDAQLKPVKQKVKAKPFERTKNISFLTKVMRTKDGNPMPEKVLQPIRDNIESKTDVFEHKTLLSDKGEGIIFEKNEEEWVNQMLEEFSIERLKNNPNSVRVLAFTNERVRQLNAVIRTKMFGFGAEPFQKGEFLMMYENLHPGGTDDYFYPNGSDVEIINADFIENHIIRSGPKEIKVSGYMMKMKDLKTNTEKPINLFVADMNYVSKEYLDELLFLKNKAIKANSNERGLRWSEYYNFSQSYNLTDNVYEINNKIYVSEGEAFKALMNFRPKSTKSDLGFYKIKDKSVDYAYAHTVHKSQGGTYDYVFVDENNIDILKNFSKPDFEFVNQLKYVAFSRSSKITNVLSTKSNINNNTLANISSNNEEFGNLIDLDFLPATWNEEDYENYLLICK